MRNFPVIAYLARRSLAESRLILALLICAVAAGVGFQVPNTANMAGYYAELIDHGVTSGFGDVRVRPADRSRFEDGDALTQTLAAVPGARAVIAVLSLPGAVAKGEVFRGAPVIGFDVGKQARPFRLGSGAHLEPGDDSGAIVGAAVARRLDVGVGDTVRVRVIFDASGDDDLDDGLGRFDLTVRGLAVGTLGSHEAVFMSRRFLAREAGTEKAATGVLVYAHDHFGASALAKRVAAAAPGIEARSWMEDSTYLRSAIRANEAVGTVSELMVIVAVTIPVLALLYINMLRRRRDVGLLAALGFAPGEVFTAFLLQAALIGIIGVGLGCAAGYGLIVYFQANPVFDWEGFVIRPVVSAGSFLRPAAVVLAATVAAGVIPAWRAARTDPARVLRGLE